MKLLNSMEGGLVKKVYTVSLGDNLKRGPQK